MKTLWRILKKMRSFLKLRKQETLNSSVHTLLKVVLLNAARNRDGPHALDLVTAVEVLILTVISPKPTYTTIFLGKEYTL
jgi:hypothetical protein